MASSDSSKTVFLAFSVNFFIAGIKTVIAILTSSSAMFSEAVHSYVDSGNQFLLWFGIKQSKKPNKMIYPLGRGKEEYFWTLVVAVLIFTIGGLVSLEHGIEALSHPKELKNFVGCFLTGTAAEVTPVSCIAENEFKVCDLIIGLNESYQQLVRKKKAA